MKKIILILVFVLALALAWGSAWGATYYVSNTATNGYAIGNDSNTTTQAQNKDTPWLTVMGAETQVTTNDIIFVNGGTYVEDDGAGFRCWVSTEDVDWIADEIVIIQGNAASNRVIQINSDVSATYTGFIFDGENTKSDGIKYGSNDGGRTFTNCTVKDVTTNLITFGTISSGDTFTDCSFTDSNGLTRIFENMQSNLILNNPTISITGAVTDLFRTVSASTGSITIVGGSVTAPGITGEVFSYRGSGAFSMSGGEWTVSGLSFLNMVTAATTGSVNISDITINYPVKSSDSIINIIAGVHDISITNNIFNTPALDQSSHIINLWDQLEPTISGNTITTLTTGGCTHLRIKSTGTEIGAAQIIGNTFNDRSRLDYTVHIGEEITGVGDEKINGILFSENVMNGSYFYTPSVAATTHGVLFGFNTAGIFTKNRFNGTHYGIVLKSDGLDYGAGYVSGNVIKVLGTVEGNSGIYAKGMTNVPVYGNTIFMESGTVMTAGLIQYAPNGANEATNGIVKNNIMKAELGSPLLLVSSGAITNFVSDYNCFDGDTWSWSGTEYNFVNYKTNSGQDANSLNIDPKVLSSGKLSSESPCIDAGSTDSAILARIGETDIFGNILFNGLPDIGANEFTPVKRIIYTRVGVCRGIY